MSLYMVEDTVHRFGPIQVKSSVTVMLLCARTSETASDDESRIRFIPNSYKTGPGGLRGYGWLQSRA